MTHNKYIQYIIALFLLLGLNKETIWANQRRDMLGGRGTNMSENRHIDRNGLRTGIYGNQHFLWGFYADGSYSALFNTVPNATFRPGGYAFSIGPCFEYQNAAFKMQIGLNVRYQEVKNRIADTTFYDLNVYDARGSRYNLQYDFYNRVDLSRNLYLQMPVLFGMGFYPMYFLAGLKPTISVYGSTKVNAFGTTSGTYEQYLGYFVEMDNHGLRKNVPIELTGGSLFGYKFDLLASVECGFEWGDDYAKGASRGSRYRIKGGIRAEYRFRIAAFVDYGLLNISPKMTKPLVYIPGDYKWDFPEYQFNHDFSTDMATKEQIHNFYAGVKVTVLFGTYVYKKCLLCGEWISEVATSGPYYNSRQARHGRNNHRRHHRKAQTNGFGE